MTDVALPPGDLHVLSLCSGGGGLDLGVRLAVRNTRTVCYVEREAFACARLEAAMRDGSLDDAPLWTDLTTFDCDPWRGLVDLVVAGWPCPPYSAAGRRLGARDERDLWPDVYRIVAALRPGLFFGENVAGFTSHPDGLTRTVRDLTRTGYRVAATLVTAADVGASHKRERCFILAVLDDTAGTRRNGARQRPSTDSGSGQRVPHQRETTTELRGTPLANTRCERDQRQRVALVVGDQEGAEHGALRQQRDGHTAGGRLEGVANADNRGRSGRGGAESAGLESPCWSGPDGRRGDGWGLDTVPLFPPGPGDRDEWYRILAHDPSLAPALEPPFRELADGVAADRMRWLRLLGNGVVPLQAAYALCTLVARLRVSA